MDHGQRPAKTWLKESMQAAEHEQLQASASCTWEPCGENGTEPGNMDEAMCPPTPPDKAVLARSRLRCGVNDTYPVSDAAVKVRRSNLTVSGNT